MRSEVYRRALESIDTGIETIGFAGFFGIATAHRRAASDITEPRLPVLLSPGASSVSGGAESMQRDTSKRLTARGKRAWGRFKLAAVSSFAFVESAGPVYLGKLTKDALARRRKALPIDPKPRFLPELSIAEAVSSADSILSAMSLTKTFARLVILAGHGANVTNNPHESALHCGACGGYSGEVNARLLAGLLNDSDVRAGLAGTGIDIPDDTLFIAALHDTTTDTVTLYSADQDTSQHAPDLDQATAWLASAGKVARGERAERLPGATNARSVFRRSRDWAQTRPEWGLANCSAFIAAPRHRTADCSLSGTAFLHNYDWQDDKDFKVLELILTAPVVVASWISLQYYGSTVSPKLFGGGNKLLHNVTGGIGVLEGNGGTLRIGLPFQSVNDGVGFAHNPLRLSVCIEAPRSAISDILARHQQVRALFDNGWLHLLAMDEKGQLAWRYTGGLNWTPMGAETAQPEGVAA